MFLSKDEQRHNRVTALFLDVGGVLLTDGWDRSMRKRAAETFDLDPADMDERHHLTFDTYELGKLSLDEYLNRMVFDRNHPFSTEEFKAFMFVEAAQGMGIRGIHHTGFESTRETLASVGLSLTK